MKLPPFPSLGLLLLSLLTRLDAVPDPHQIRGHSPVSVSSLNYVNTPPADQRQLVGQTAVNAEVPPRSALESPRHFVFMPGEITLPNPRDPRPTYEELCAMLTPALAVRGFHNAANEAGIIKQPGRVSLVLRVHYGERDWRLPVVRTEQLAWSDGLVAKPRGRSLTTLGGDVVWDSRAGGNDRATSALAQNDANTNSFFGSGGGAASASEAAGAAPLASGTADTLGVYGDTREFFLIVVDAFDYAELKTKGKKAKRQWTTFVAAPKQRHQTFADLARTLIKNATPYFGETSHGLQIYTDSRAEVTIGEAIVVEEDAN